jgi:hypothetical protein
MNGLRIFAAAVLTLVLADRACAHGAPIIITASGDELSTNGTVFSAEFEPLGGLTYSDIPGFEMIGFQLGDEVTFDIVDHLWYWTPALGVTPAADGIEFIVEGNSLPFPMVSVAHNPDHVPGHNLYKPGFVFETIDGQSTEHQHLLSYFFETTDVPAGGYAIMLQVKSEGYVATDPFLIAFNLDLGEAQFQEGIVELRERAFFIDEPGIPGDFNEDGLVNATDIDLLLAARGSDEPDIFDIVPDNTIDDLDAQYWVETIVGTRYGDVNLDGRIDLSDLNAVRNHFGGGGGWAAGDSVGSGLVDLPDLNAVRNEFGFVAASSVPEPGSMAICVIAAAGAMFAARFRRG